MTEAFPRCAGCTACLPELCPSTPYRAPPIGEKIVPVLASKKEHTPKLQKRAFSAYEHKHWILMRAERAGALPGHARSALAGHRTRGAR